MTTQTTRSTSYRQRLIRLIHVAKGDLLMDDDTYRSVLERIGKRTSSADMTVPELEKVLEHLKRSGFQVRTANKSPSVRKPVRPSRALAQDAESKKIRALWLFLHELGVVKNPSEEALAAYVKRIAGVDALQWINGIQAERLIETMKKWAMRFLPQIVQALAPKVGALPLSDFDRCELNGLLRAAYTRLTFDPMYAAWVALTKTLKEGR
jgi:phage gp16-like protein